MTFTYPAVFTPRKNNNGFHVEFPDLEFCKAEGADLEDAVENAMDAAYNWICAELEEEDCDLPAQTHAEDLVMEEGAFLRNIMVTIKLMPDND